MSIHNQENLIARGQGYKRPDFILIAGPCAAETSEQMLQSGRNIKDIDEGLKAQGIDVKVFHRGPHFKPRTEDAFDGIGWRKWAPIARGLREMGLSVATEITDPNNMRQLKRFVQERANGEALGWGGSRNQLHLNQRGIARVASGESRLPFMYKQQMWRDPRHEAGIVTHMLAGYSEPNPGQLLLCHRGYAEANEEGNRNNPDLERAMKWKAEATFLMQEHWLSKMGMDVKDRQDTSRLRDASYVRYVNQVIEHFGLGEATTVPMILDVSHTMGKRDRVVGFSQKGIDYISPENGLQFDGIIVETHPCPEQAWTDRPQQIDKTELKEIADHIVKQRSPLAGVRLSAVANHTNGIAVLAT